MKLNGGIPPTRQDIEFLIRSCCAPESGRREKWAQVDFPVLYALRQCEAESSFKPDSVSPRGAIGLFQIMPKTAEDLKIDPKDWRQNIYGGIKYDKILHTRYNGDLGMVFAAYNHGMGNVDRLIAQFGDPQWKVRLPRETIDYCCLILKGIPRASQQRKQTQNPPTPSGRAVGPGDLEEAQRDPGDGKAVPGNEAGPGPKTP